MKKTRLKRKDAFHQNAYNCPSSVEGATISPVEKENRFAQRENQPSRGCGDLSLYEHMLSSLEKQFLP